MAKKSATKKPGVQMAKAIQARLEAAGLETTRRYSSLQVKVPKGMTATQQMGVIVKLINAK